jgi:hypothetical protein
MRFFFKMVLKQGDASSALPFNFTLEFVFKKVEEGQVI